MRIKEWISWVNVFFQKKVFLTIAAFLIIIGCLFCGAAGYWYTSPQKNAETIVLIPNGTPASKTVELLSENKVITYPLVFKSLIYVMGDWRYIKAGEYKIPAKTSPAELLRILKSGRVLLHPVTLTEGETSHQFLSKLMQDDRFEGVCEVPAEGALLPETYHFPRGTKRSAIIRTLKNAMTWAVTPLWEEYSAALPLNSIEEFIALASIVEKETCKAKERPVVAAVFINRLKIGMPLQADPTVVYGLTQGKDSLKRPITLNDLKEDTPYNSYLYQGLPPTPIANPGLSALKAVANPANVEFLYFVADGTGGHVFSTTLGEHQKNHAEWRKIRQSQQEISQ